MSIVKKLITYFVFCSLFTLCMPIKDVFAASKSKLPLKYNIDFVKYNDNKKSIDIQGWALSGAGIKNVLIVVNGKTYNTNPAYRPDVYNAYKSYNNKNSGFSKSISGVNGTNIKVEIRIIEKNGKVTKYTTTLKTSTEPFNESDFQVAGIKLINIRSYNVESLFGKSASSEHWNINVKIDNYKYQFANFSFADDYIYNVELLTNAKRGPRDTYVGENIYSVMSKFKHDDKDMKNSLLYVDPKYINSHFSECRGEIKYNNNKIEEVYYATRYWDWRLTYKVKDNKVKKIILSRMID